MATGRTIYLARHGETELNRLGIVQGSGIDPGLNEFGEAQAAALFSDLGTRVDFVASSGMVRARQTAEPFVLAGLTYVEDRGFREICWGEYEGKVADAEMRVEYQHIMQRWESGDYSAAHRGGESAQELANRLWAAWLDLLGHSFESALVVTHGRALRCLTCLLAGEPLSRMNGYAHVNAGYYEVCEVANGVWQLSTKHRVAHLDVLNQSQPSA